MLLSAFLFQDFLLLLLGIIHIVMLCRSISINGFQSFISEKFSMSQPIRKIKTTSGIRDFHVSADQKLLLAVAFDTIKIYDVQLGYCINSIKLQSSPRLVKLSPNGRYFAVYDNNTNIILYETTTATIMQNIINVPQSIKFIRCSGNSRKLLYASTQLICLWNVNSNTHEIYSQNWKNINCYDVNYDGSQFAFGGYNGAIFVISYFGQGKCGQIQIKRHKSCVISMCFHKDKLISVSYDGNLLISTLSLSKNGQRQISYKQMHISSVPRQIQSVGNNFYMFIHRGMTWFTSEYVLVGFVDSKIYKPLVNEEGQLIFVKLIATEIQWWSGGIIKQSLQIE